MIRGLRVRPHRVGNILSWRLSMEYFHYENTPIQIYRKLHLQKLKIFRLKNSDIFHISAQNIDCGTR